MYWSCSGTQVFNIILHGTHSAAEPITQSNSYGNCTEGMRRDFHTINDLMATSCLRKQLRQYVFNCAKCDVTSLLEVNNATNMFTFSPATQKLV